jgi:hypothetical protein
MKKKTTAFLIFCLLCAFCTACAAEERPGIEKYVRYFAGLEMILTDKTLSRPAQASRYRRLCAVTGVSGADAKVFMTGYRDDPAGWQKFMASVLEALEKKKK